MGILEDAWDFVKHGGQAHGVETQATPEQDAQHAAEMAAADAKEKEHQRIIAGGNQSELAAWEAANYGDESNRGGRSNFLNPGAANVGGAVGAGKDIHDFFRAGEKANDAAQRNNSAAMGLSLDRMKTERAPLAENGALVGREAASRGQQLQATDLARQAAMGQAPSAADAQMGMQSNDVMQGQAGAMGSARGLSALRGAQTMGAAGVGMQGTQVAMGGGMARSREVNDAMGAYGGLAGDVRAGDLGRVNQTNQNALAGQSINDDWRVGNANLAGKQAQLGNSQGQVDDAYFGASQEPAARQLGYDQEMKAIEAGASQDAAGAKRASTNADLDRRQQFVQGGITAGLGIIGGPVGGMMGSAIRR